ncbi:MAG: trimeric intracellular cation channel family protein [Veillonella sp.]|nr:trimeric intracellular cation channel family protein [Veillonella sp.]
MELVWYVFEYAGTIAFAISGALIGISRNMDIFGMTVLAMVTAIGGGIIRDLLVGEIPPHSLQSSTYVLLIIAVTVILFLIYRTHYRKRMAGTWARRTYLLADALGLASFTVTGTSVGVKVCPDMATLAIILGVVTAVGGGIIRDVLAQRIPSVLREDVYALPAIIGGAVYYLVAQGGLVNWAAVLSFATVFIIRIMAMYFHWSLPKVRKS